MRVVGVGDDEVVDEIVVLDRGAVCPRRRGAGVR